MHLLVATFMVLMPSAFAQYGHGYYGALNCPQPYQAAPGAIDPNDLLRNNRGLINQSAQQIGLIQRRADALGQLMVQERLQLRGFLGAPGLAALQAHQQYGRGPGEYAAQCAGAPAVAGPPIPAGNLALPPSPQGFCVNVGGRVQNLWVTSFAGPGGRLNESICNMVPPAYRVAQPPIQAQACRARLNSYYQHAAEEATLRQQIAGLNANVRTWQAEETELVNAQTAAQSCADCDLSHHGWSADDSLASELGPIFSILRAFSSLGGGGRGGLYGGGGFGGGRGPYPGVPYAARLRHYYGARGPQYGAVPGGIGAGAFAGCGGPGALGRGAQFAPPVMPAFNQRGVNPLGPEYGNDLLNPAAQNDLFNPGFGPGFGPSLGNGLNVQPRFLSAPQPFQYAPPPVQFAQAPPYLPVTQMGFGNLGRQLGPGSLIGSPVVQNVFRPPVPAPAVLPAIASINPGFGVGQPMPAAYGYGVLTTQVNRAQYGLGIMQGAPGVVPAMGANPMPANYAPLPIARPPAPAVLPLIRSY